MKVAIQLFVFFGSLFIGLQPAFSQKRASSHDEYIKKYHRLAVEHQQKYKIPASITLAQGILESGAGKSDLAKRSNNHFGIKCHTDWTGDRTYHTDDIKNDCFRVYKTVEESFEDHSRFLAERKRYAELFTYDITDYKKWARGLQKCGYATSKAYANRLIKIIEDYELYHYDGGEFLNAYPVAGEEQKPKKPVKGSTTERQLQKKSGLQYTVASHNDTFEQIAEETGYKLKDLLKYNEASADFPLQEGDIIYLQKKKSKADKPHFDHVVKIGESMHSISQAYGVQMSSLYKINKKKKDYVPEEGDVLRLR
jgi:Muramidase (flagellum-specific)